MRRWVVIAVVVFLAFLGILAFFYARPAPRFSLVATGTGPGWVNITLESNLALKNATLVIARPAELESCSESYCRFKYWLAPGEPTGNYTARVHVYTVNGEMDLTLPIKLESRNWGKLGSLYYYGANFSETAEKFRAKNVSVLAYFTPQESRENSIVIKAEMAVIAGLAALNKTIHFYAITTDLKNCTFTIPGKNETKSLPVSECLEAGDPRIVIEQPIYPTSQVRVENNTFYLEGDEGLVNLAKEFMLALAKHIKEE